MMIRGHSKLAVAIVVAAILCIGAVRAACPANGNTHALYVTLNNRRDIMSLDSNGRFVSGVINFTSIPPDVRLAKLRAMAFGLDGHLYVSSAMSELSRIIVLSGKLNVDCTRDYLGTFQVLDRHANPLMDHPYDIKFLVDSNRGTSIMFVTNQNTASVTRYCGPRAPPSVASSGSSYYRSRVGAPPAPTIPSSRSSQLGDAAGAKGHRSSDAATQDDLWKCNYGDPLPPPQYLIDGITIGTGGTVASVADAAAAAAADNAADSKEGRSSSSGSSGRHKGRRGNADAEGKSDAAPHAPWIPDGTFIVSDHAKYRLRSVRGMALYQPPDPRVWRRGRSRHLTQEQADAWREARRIEAEDGPLLVLCDIDGSDVFVFSALTGAYLWNYHHRIPFPVQVIIPSQQYESSDLDHPYIYVTSKTPGVIFKAELARSANVVPLMSNQGFLYTSGIVEIPAHGGLLIADRGASQIVTFTVADHGNEALTERVGLFGKHTDLGDHPEHLMYVTLVDPQRIPFCYELGASGLKRAPLCEAVSIWWWSIVAVLALYGAREILLRWDTGRRSVTESKSGDD